MTETKICKKCGRVFNSIGGNKFCFRCITDDNDYFNIIKDYIKNNKNATITKISEDTEISLEKMNLFLEEGRFENLDVKLDKTCEKCGAVIIGGRYCKNCKAEVTNGFKKVAKDIEKSIKETDNSFGNTGMYSKNKKK